MLSQDCRESQFLPCEPHRTAHLFSPKLFLKIMWWRCNLPCFMNVCCSDAQYMCEFHFVFIPDSLISLYSSTRHLQFYSLSHSNRISSNLVWLRLAAVRWITVRSFSKNCSRNCSPDKHRPEVNILSNREMNQATINLYQRIIDIPPFPSISICQRCIPL